MNKTIITIPMQMLTFVFSIIVPISIIHWGIGDKMLFHPDEMYFNIANVVNLLAHSKELEFFNYPHYLFNSVFIAYHVLNFIGVDIDTFGIAYIGRSIVAVHYAACVLLIMKILMYLNFSRSIIYICTGLSALLPAFIMHSVFITDLPMTFYILLTGYFCLRAQSQGNNLFLVFASISLGFAVGCKFTAALASVMIVWTAFHMPVRLAYTTIIKNVSLYAFIAFITFCLISPLSILHIADLIRGLLYELDHVNTGHLGQETLTHSWRFWPLLYPFTALLPFGLGPLLFFGVFGIYFIVREKHTRAIGLFAILWFIAFGVLTFQPLRYQFPVIVISIIGFAFILQKITQHTLFSKHSTFSRLTIICAIAAQLYYSYTFIDRYLNDTRVSARTWLENTLARDSHIIFFTDQAYNPVPTYAPIKEQHFNQASWYSHKREAKFVLTDKRAEYLVLSSINYLRDYRDKTNNLGHLHAVRNNQTQWQLLKRFSDRHLAKRALFFLDPFFSSYFLSPDIEIYKRPANLHTLPLTIDFAEHGNADQFTSRNWYSSYKGTQWMKSEGGELTFRLAKNLPQQDIEVTLTMRIYSDKDSNNIQLLFNDSEISHYTLHNTNKGASDAITKKFVIPAHNLKDLRYFTLRLKADTFVQPQSLFPKLLDNRNISVGLDTISLRSVTQ